MLNIKFEAGVFEDGAVRATSSSGSTTEFGSLWLKLLKTTFGARAVGAGDIRAIGARALGVGAGA
jgi:hypothetical protein